MSDDNGRTHLVAKLQCIECGELLKMSYEKPKKHVSDYSQGEPTGYIMLENIITVYPCKCTLVANERLKELQRILGIKNENND